MMMDPLKDLREVAETWKNAGRDREFVHGQLIQVSKNEQAVTRVLDEFFPIAPVPVSKPNGHSTPEEARFAETAPDTFQALTEPPAKTVAGESIVPPHEAERVEDTKTIDPFPKLPTELKQLNGFVTWGGNVADKQPYISGTNVPASYKNPNDLRDYTTAIANLAKGLGKPCLGLVPMNGYVALDFDSCREPKTDVIADWATNFISLLREIKPEGTYSHVTPSGSGLRIWLKVPSFGQRIETFRFSSELAAYESKDPQVEVLGTRYVTLEGEIFDDVIFGEAPSTVSKLNETEWSRLRDYLSGVEKEHPRQNPTEKPAKKGDFDPDPGFEKLFEQVGWEPLIQRLNKMEDTRFHNLDLTVNEFCPMPGHGTRGVNIPYTSKVFSIIKNQPNLVHCFGCNFSGDLFTTIRTFEAGEEGGGRTYGNYYDVAKAICEENGLKFEDYFAPFQDRRLKMSSQLTGQPTRKHSEQSTTAAPVAAPALAAEDEIPAFNENVITGIYKEIVDLVTEGTTIPKQFAFLAAKVFVGARLAGRITFQNMDADSSYYGVVIAETGTGKGLAWRRTVENCLMVGESLRNSVQIIQSADSGAGLKDAFFDDKGNAITLPVICYVDEATSLGHKAGERKNPEIVDAIIELADGHRITRTLSKREGGRHLVNNNARLSLYMCGQNGEVFMRAFAGRTKLGLYDRFYPEYSPEIEAGDLPDIDSEKAAKMWTAINSLLSKATGGQMTTAEGVKPFIEEFWKAEPKEHRAKVRWKKYLMLDMYMAAFGRGSMIAEAQDWEVAKKIYLRQVGIREKHFTTEVPDNIGVYNSRLRIIVERMRARLLAGELVQQVALSERDFMTATNAYRDSDLHTFNLAWRAWESALLASVKIKGKNGQDYKKYVPMPNEDETWKME